MSLHTIHIVHNSTCACSVHTPHHNTAHVCVQHTNVCCFASCFAWIDVLHASQPALVIRDSI